MINGALFDELSTLMEHVEGANNYDANCIVLTAYRDGVEVESIHINEYGGIYGNEDTQYISWDKLSWDAILTIECEIEETETMLIHNDL
jgi:hypothetical protein